MPPTEEARRKQLCDHLGREALGGAPRELHTKFAYSGSVPPSTPDPGPAVRHALAADQPPEGSAPERAALGGGCVPGPARGAALPHARGAEGAGVVRPLAAAARRGGGGAGLVQRAPRRPRGGRVPHAPGRRRHRPRPVPPPAPALPQRVRGGHCLEHPPGVAGLLHRLSGPASELEPKGPVPPPLPGGAQHADGERLGAEGAAARGGRLAGPAHRVQPEELLLLAPPGGDPGAPGGPVGHAVEPDLLPPGPGGHPGPGGQHAPRPAFGREHPAPDLPPVAPGPVRHLPGGVGAAEAHPRGAHAAVVLCPTPYPPNRAT